MISIIICSRTPKLNPVLSQNIEQTIGCNFELIVIDNSSNKYSIFQAYNLGIQKSKGDYFCFMHDDIVFHTQNWGVKILRVFEEDFRIGLLGVAGAKIKTKMPSGWWDCPSDLKNINIIQHFPNKDKELVYMGWQTENQIEEVAVIDGVFMFARKKDFVFFNQEDSGFHNYDLYLSAIYHKHDFKVVVLNSLLIEHFSLGNLNAKWVEYSHVFFNKYKKLFPINKSKLNVLEFKKLELLNGFIFIERLIIEGELTKAFSIWVLLFRCKPISMYHWRILLKLIEKHK
jgi:hypothetical protein